MLTLQDVHGLTALWSEYWPVLIIGVGMVLYGWFKSDYGFRDTSESPFDVPSDPWERAIFYGEE